VRGAGALLSRGGKILTADPTPGARPSVAASPAPPAGPISASGAGRSRWFSQGLRYRLLGFFALSLAVPTAMTGGVVMLTGRHSLLEAAFREQREVARRIGDRVAAHVGNVKTVLFTLAARTEFADLNRDEQFAALEQLMENYPYLMECAVINASGREVLKAVRRGPEVVLSRQLLSRAAREEFRRPRAGASYVSPVFFTARERFPQMFVAVPLGQGPGPRRKTRAGPSGSAGVPGKPALAPPEVLLARLSLDTIWDLVSQVKVGKTGFAFVVDAKGNLLAHPVRERVLAHENLSKRSVVREFLTADPAAEESPEKIGRVHRGARGEKTVAIYHRVPDLGWGVFVQIPLREALAPVRAMARQVALVVAVFGALFLAGGLSLIRKILEPLRQLQQGVQKIGQGDLAHRLHIRTGDEIASLAQEFNTMAASLEKLERTKRDLTHMIVHDLKSPLTGVMGCIDFVASGATGSLTPDQKKILSIGSKSGRDLLRMVQNLLDIAKMEEGRLTLHKETFSLLDLVGECADDLDAHVRRDKKILSMDVAKDLPPLPADRDLIYRTLINLVTNALKHSPEGTEVRIRASLADDGQGIVLSVKDQGEGIPPEYFDRIFEKFEQAETKQRRVRTGSGLGLTFCKLAVDAHGGRIWVDSKVGEGSEFFVFLPLEAPDRRAPAEGQAAPPVLAGRTDVG
jgi:signal transduction histidine kinase